MKIALAAAALAAASVAVPVQATTPLEISFSAFATGTSTLTTCTNTKCSDVVSPFSGVIGRDIYFSSFDGDDIFTVSTPAGPFLGQEASYSGRVIGTVNPFGNGLIGSNFSYLESDGKHCAGQVACSFTTIRLNAASFSIVQISPAPVPEPVTWALMLVGFGAVGFTMRLRQRVNMRVDFV